MTVTGEVLRPELDARGAHAVEHDLFVSPGPDDIVATVAAFCVDHLGAALDGYLFFRSASSSLHGVRLTDGRELVIRVQSPWQRPGAMEGAWRVQSYLAARGFPCPSPVLGPTPLGLGVARVEEFVRASSVVDAHEASTRRTLAATLARLTEECRAFGPDVGLGDLVPFQRLWPLPRRRDLDFDATASGAEWIDEHAVEARMRYRDESPRVVGHADWRVQHTAWDGNRLLAVIDSDGLCCERESVVVGAAAAQFTMSDVRDGAYATAPGVDEIMAFVGDYEDATGRRFRGAERSTLFAACVYRIAFLARCEHVHAAVPAGETAATARGAELAEGDAGVEGPFGALLRSSAGEILAG